MKLIALIVIFVAVVGCISAEPLLGSLLKNPLLKGVTGPLNGVVNIVKDTIGTVADVLKGLICVLDGLLDSVTKITCSLTTVGSRSVAPTLNRLTGVLCGVFSTLNENANNMNGTGTCNTNVVGSALKNVEVSVTQLVQLVNTVVEIATHNTGSHDSLLCSIDHSVLDLGATVADLIRCVVKFISEINGPITKDQRKVLCSLHLLLKTVLAIVHDILSNVSDLLAKCNLPTSNVLSSINCQLSRTLAGVSKIVGKLIKSDKCLVPELVASLRKIVESLSNTLQSLTETVGCIVGNLTPVLIGLTSKVKALAPGNVADVTPDVYEELVSAINGTFTQIQRAVSVVAGEVGEVNGLVDVSVKNILTGIIVIIQCIGSITVEHIQQCGCENGIDKHMTIAHLQLLTLLQTAVDCIIYLAKHTLFSAKVANVLERIVCSIFAAIETIFTSVDGLLLVALIDAVGDDASNVNNISTETLRSITSAIIDDEGILGQSLRQLGAAVDALLDPDVDVSACTLYGLNGSLSGVSGSLRGTLSGVTSALGDLTKRLGCDVDEVAEPVVAGSLQDLIKGLKTKNSTVIDALNEVVCGVANILQTLRAVISSLDAVNGCGCGHVGALYYSGHIL